MNIHVELENRINKRLHYDKLHKINSYGGMGMDCISKNEEKNRIEEIDYMRKHPEMFNKQIKPNDNSMYIIKLK